MNKNLTFSKCRAKTWTGFSLLSLFLLLLTACTTTQNVKTVSVAQEPVTAIDILLEPDTTMLQHAEAVNARLLKVYPKGFALDVFTSHILPLYNGMSARLISTKSMLPPAMS